jgi:ribosome recycling factor
MASSSKDLAYRVLHRFLVASRTPRIAQRSLSRRCQNVFLQQTHHTRHSSPGRVNADHAFSTSSTAQKKSSGSAKSSRKSPDLSSLSHKDDKHVPDNKATKSRDAEIDPYDFTELDAGIAKAVSRLKDALLKTKDAGRVTPEMIEQLPVEINVKSADSGRGSAHREKSKVGDLASVVAKGGRTVNVFCGEEAVRYARHTGRRIVC